MWAVQSGYSFGHRLTRDAAYAGLLERNRRLLHAAALDGLAERDVPGALGERELLEELVTHAAGAGRWRQAHELLCRLLHIVGSGEAYAQWPALHVQAGEYWQRACAADPAAPAVSPHLLLAEADYARRRGDLALARQRLEAALELGPADAASVLRGRILSMLGVVESRFGHMEQSRAYQSQALELLRGTSYAALVLCNLASDLHALERPAESQVCLEEALALALAAGDRRTEGLALGSLGVLAYRRGELAKAEELYTGELAAARATGRIFSESWALAHLAGLAEARGELAQARQLLEQDLALVRQLGNRPAEGQSLVACGSMAARLGELTEAVDLLTQGWALASAVGDRTTTGQALGQLGLISYRRGDPAAGAQQLAAGCELIAQAGDRLKLGELQAEWLGQLDCSDPDQAALAQELEARLATQAALLV